MNATEVCKGTFHHHENRRMPSLTFTISKMRIVVAKSFSRLHALKAASTIFGSGTMSASTKVLIPIKRREH